MIILILHFKMTINSDGTLTFNQRIHNEWKDSFSPYVKALEDKIVIVDGGKVRYVYLEIVMDILRAF